jgi:putative DNA primase/helicase
VRAAAVEQEDRYEGDPWDEPIATWVDGRENVSVSDVLTRCIEKPLAQWNQGDKNRVARALRSMGWERYRKRDAGELEWRYRRKA